MKGSSGALRLAAVALLGCAGAARAQAGRPRETVQPPCVLKLVIGRSVQGRPLELVVVGRRETIARKAPRLLILCGQHGDEPTAGRAAWAVVRRLSRAGDAESKTILSRVVTLVVPCANPDGAARHARGNASGADLNRDWVRRHQPETRALFNVFARWRPQLVVDAHEWAPGDLHTANTVELPRPDGMRPGSPANARWQREWVWPALARCQESGVPVRPARWTPGADDRLAHRYLYAAWGVPAILYETMPAGLAPSPVRMENATRFLWEILCAFAESAPAPPAAPAAKPAPPPLPTPAWVATAVVLVLLVPFARPRVRPGTGRRPVPGAWRRNRATPRRAASQPRGPELRSPAAGYVVPPKERLGTRFQGGTAWQRPPGRNGAGAGRDGTR